MVKISNKEVRVEIAGVSMQGFMEQFGFNVSKDIRKLKISNKNIDLILLDLLSYLSDRENITHIQTSLDGKFSIIKTRHANPQNNKGKASGFRLISLAIIEDDENAVYVTVFHIYSKDGPKSKANLTHDEKNNCKEMVEFLYENNEE